MNVSRASVIVSIGVILLATHIVHAKKTVSDAEGILNTVANQSGVSKSDVPTVSGEIIQNMLQLTSLIFFVLLVYAGFRWMLARGNEEEVTTARKTLIMATIGIVIVAGSYAITNYVTSRIIEGEANSGGLPDLENADYTNLGCCFDKVRHPGNAGELRATNWSWRITSEGDCQEQGEKTTSFDEIAGPGTWQYTNVDSKQQCEVLYTEFCKSTDCYDLGF